MTQAQARIREAVIRNRQDKLTALLHHVSVDVLRASFFGLKKTAAPGVEETRWSEYAEHLEANLLDLHARVHTGAYRALPSRRKYIDAPKVYFGNRRSAIPVLSDVSVSIYGSIKRLKGTVTVMPVTLASSAFARATPYRTAFLDNSEPSVVMRMCL